jgi:hypothetical protein
MEHIYYMAIRECVRSRVMKSRGMERVRLRASVGKMRNAYKILVGKPEGKRQLGKT